MKLYLQKYLVPAMGLAFLIAAVLHVLTAYTDISFPTELLLSARWLALVLLILYGFSKNSLTTWILISMLLGAEVGLDFPTFSQNLNVVSKVFLRMIKSIIAPLLFATLVLGIAGHSDIKQVGRMGWKSLVYFEIVTTIALFIGLAAINITQAGVGIELPPVTNKEGLPTAPAPQKWDEIILHIFPENFALAVAEGQVLQIVVFSIVFGIGLAMVSESHKHTMLQFTESLAEVMFKFTNIVMQFAPFAVFAAMAYSVGHMGIEILKNLLMLLATLYIALIVFIFLVFLPVALIIRLPIKRFVLAIAEPVTLAFATTSSESALPKAMKAMESIGVPRKIVAFVMPTGYSFNLDGTTLYLALATVFVAQSAKIEMSFSHQLLIVFTLMLTSKGVAGVPRASLVILLATATQFNLPVEPIFIILGIDELMDMARTSVNVVGNCLATAVVARWEGEFDDKYVEESKVSDEVLEINK